jgi:hypothetical protein
VRDAPSGVLLHGIRCAGALAVAAAPFFLVSVLAAEIIADTGVTERMWGSLVGVFFSVAFLSARFSARAVRRFGAARTVALGVAATSTSLFVVGGTVSPLAALLGLVGCGVGFALVDCGANVTIHDQSPDGGLYLALAVKETGPILAAMLAGASVSLLLGWISWRTILVGAAVTGAVVVGQWVRLASAQPRPMRVACEPPFPPELVVRPRPRIPIGRPLGAVLAMSGATGLTAHALTGLQRVGVGANAVGQGVAAGSLAAVLLRLGLGALAAGRPERAPQLGAATAGLAVVGCALLAWARTPAAIVVGLVLATAGAWSWGGIYFGVMLQGGGDRPEDRSAAAIAGVYLGGVIGPVLVGLLLSRGHAAPWLAVGALLSIGSVLMFRRVSAAPPGFSRT